LNVRKLEGKGSLIIDKAVNFLAGIMVFAKFMNLSYLHEFQRFLRLPIDTNLTISS